MFYLKFFFSANQMEKVCETIFNGPFIKSLQTFNSFDPKFLSAQFVVVRVLASVQSLLND